MVDWNEDGLKDLIVGEYNGKVRYYQNIGTVGNPSLHFVGYLQASGRDIDCGDYSVPFSQDWNEDGMKDLLVGDSNGLFYLFINIGTNAAPVFGNFVNINTVTGAPADVGYRSGPNVVDLNDDGLKDLVSGDMVGNIYYFQNNGTNANPALASMVALKTGTADILSTGTSRVTTVDWEEDGDLDLVVGHYSALLYLYKQTPSTQTMPTFTLDNAGPMIIPATGGYYRYTIQSVNGTASAATFDLWTRLKYPNGTMSEPIILRNDIILQAGGALARTLALTVPAAWASGYYYYYGWIGDYSANQIYATDYGYFMKATGDGSGGILSWGHSDWDEEETIQSLLPAEIELYSAAPNPFNPTTNLTFTLPENGEVTLVVYDSQGRAAATLEQGYLNAGTYERTFDGSGLASGVYFACLRMKGEMKTQKLLLVK